MNSCCLWVIKFKLNYDCSYLLPSVLHTNYYYANRNEEIDNHHQSIRKKNYAIQLFIKQRKEKPQHFQYFLYNSIASSKRLTLWVSLTSISMIHFDIILYQVKLEKLQGFFYIMSNCCYARVNELHSLYGKQCYDTTTIYNRKVI